MLSTEKPGAFLTLSFELSGSDPKAYGEKYLKMDMLRMQE